jgi:hypothetical protein
MMLPVLGWCQTEHFLYLQTDNKQAFYVRLNNKIYSSSKDGHLIFGKLPAETTVQLIVGFAKNEYEEQLFVVPVKSDLGFVLKYYGDKNWSLSNVQTLEIIRNTNNGSAPTEKTGGISSSGGVRKTDQFSRMLAAAVNDSSILYAVADIPEQEEESLAKNNKAQPSVTEKIDTTAEAYIANKPPVTEEPKSFPPPAIPDFIKKDTNTAIPETSATTKPPLLPQKDSFKKESIAGVTPAVVQENPKKDTLFVNSKTIEESIRSIIDSNNATLMATRINKAAEIFTDTSYIAVFIDTLTTGFDTIRVSIPFDESKMILRATSSATRPTRPIDTATETRKESAITISTEIPPVVANTKIDNKEIHTIAPPATTNNEAVKNPAINAKTPTLAKPEKKPVAPKNTKTGKPTKAVVAKQAVVNEKKDRDSSLLTPPAQKTNPTTAITQKQVPYKKIPLGLPDISSTRGEITVVNETVKQPATSLQVPEPTKELPNPVVKQPEATELPKETTVQKVIEKKDSIQSVEKKKSFVTNSDCQIYASDNDLDKLRVKLLAQRTDDDKLATARKIFRQRCFNSRHIKALTELFSTDEGKYRWLDAAYPFVSDPSNYELLREVLKDPYFINRFNAMIRHE